MEEHTRLLALTADVGRALTTRKTLADMLTGCAEALVKHLEAAFARVWTLNTAENVLELQASAGLYTHLDGPHGRVPVGQFKIGLIAQERRPHLTNAVVGDPRVSDQEWAKHEGMAAFAGYPLVVEDQLVGVVALFARRPLSEVTLQALGSVADQIAIGIDRRRAEEALRVSQARQTAILEVALDCIITIDKYGRITEFNPAAETTFGYTRAEALGQPVAETIIPPSLRPLHHEGFDRYLIMGEGPVLGQRIELTGMRKDGSEFPVEIVIVPLGDADGLEFTAYLRDITRRREAERAQAAVYEREHAIATQLQEALNPAIPKDISGLQVAQFARPALDEAHVGGDFFDVFALDQGRYALVIGDVSGKGVAAAAQIATVRHMLRMVLYQHLAVAEAIVHLNTTLTSHDLLVGFVTAFVGVYDVGTGRLTYASCGHEPGLLRRAGTGAVEPLESTGLPLGVDENAGYGENGVTLSDGDTLLLYTDGLSEAGPSRRQMLGTEGLIRLLTALPEGGDIHNAATKIVTEANAYANGVFRDDVCVLLMRRMA